MTAWMARVGENQSKRSILRLSNLGKRNWRLLRLNCVNCGSVDSKIISQAKAIDRVNEFGRREISFSVEHQDIVTYGKDGLYHCLNCGSCFTFQEAASQKKKIANPQQKLLG
jgi:uncharacterized Zn finger protein